MRSSSDSSLAMRLPSRSFEDYVKLESKHETTDDRTDLIGLDAQLRLLPAPMRQVLVWQYFEGMTQQEIADEKGWPLGTVKTRTRMALQALRTVFLEQ